MNATMDKYTKLVRFVSSLIVASGVLLGQTARVQALGCIAYDPWVYPFYESEYFGYCSAADCSQGGGYANISDCNGFFFGDMATECTRFCVNSPYPSYSTGTIWNYYEYGSESGGMCLCS